jgi:hypothetical protein
MTSAVIGKICPMILVEDTTNEKAGGKYHS